MNNERQIVWPGGRKAAVSLTYDDGIPAHFEMVAPLLEQYGIRGTFYVPVVSGLRLYPGEFGQMAKAGHELGNHSLFHPCRRTADRAPWLHEAYDLCTYTERRWNEEMMVANFALQMVDGQSERTFGNTCYDNWIGPDDRRIFLEPFMKDHFIAARGEKTGRPVNLSQFNIWNLGTIGADYRTFDDLKVELETLAASGGWIIYTMHGVGAETHRHHIKKEAHLRMLEWLAEHSAQVWTAPVIEIIRHLKSE